MNKPTKKPAKASAQPRLTPEDLKARLDKASEVLEQKTKEDQELRQQIEALNAKKSAVFQEVIDAKVARRDALTAYLQVVPLTANERRLMLSFGPYRRNHQGLRAISAAGRSLVEKGYLVICPETAYEHEHLEKTDAGVELGKVLAKGKAS